jgi:hypothetical protein
MPIVPPQVMEEVVSERESQNIGTQSTARNTLTVVESASKIEERIADSSDEVPKPQKPFQAQLALHDVESQSTDPIQLALGRGSLVVAESGESDQLNLPSTFKETSSNLTIESIELPQRGCESVSENLNGQSQAVPTNLFPIQGLGLPGGLHRVAQQLYHEWDCQRQDHIRSNDRSSRKSNIDNHVVNSERCDTVLDNQHEHSAKIISEAYSK